MMTINVKSITRKVEVDNRIPLHYYYRIADNLLRQADIYRDEKNIVDLYIMLVRFTSLVSETIPLHRDYQILHPKEKTTYRKKLLQVLDELESLKPKFQLRVNELNIPNAGEQLVKVDRQERFAVTSGTSSQDWSSAGRNSNVIMDKQQLILRIEEQEERKRSLRAKNKKNRRTEEQKTESVKSADECCPMGSENRRNVRSRSISSSNPNHGASRLRMCYCGLVCSVKSAGTWQNFSRRFHGCPNFESIQNPGCGFFDWEDPTMCPYGRIAVMQFQQRENHLKEQLEVVKNQALESRPNRKLVVVFIIVVVVVFVLSSIAKN